MAVVVVGGGGRGVGKTALVCGVICALPDIQWVAIKITGHEHGLAPRVFEESEPGQGTDTARYLAAGARRAFLLTAADGTAIKVAMEALREHVEGCPNILIESNRVLDFVRPDLCLLVRASAKEAAAKASFDSVSSLADAVIIPGTADAFHDGLRPEFELARLERLSPALEHWIRGRLIYG
jgi:hypothetical protein